MCRTAARQVAQRACGLGLGFDLRRRRHDDQRRQSPLPHNLIHAIICNRSNALPVRLAAAAGSRGGEAQRNENWRWKSGKCGCVVAPFKAKLDSARAACRWTLLLVELSITMSGGSPPAPQIAAVASTAYTPRLAVQCIMLVECCRGQHG